MLESKNTGTASLGGSKTKAQEKGLWAEARVREFLIEKKFVLVHERFRTPYGEIDLVVESPSKRFWLMVEVKSLSRLDWSPQRLHWKQRQRLLRAREYLQIEFEKLVEFRLAFVHRNSEIQWVSDFF